MNQIEQQQNLNEQEEDQIIKGRNKLIFYTQIFVGGLYFICCLIIVMSLTITFQNLEDGYTIFLCLGIFLFSIFLLGQFIYMYKQLENSKRNPLFQQEFRLNYIRLKTLLNIFTAYVSQIDFVFNRFIIFYCCFGMETFIELITQQLMNTIYQIILQVTIYSVVLLLCAVEWLRIINFLIQCCKIENFYYLVYSQEFSKCKARAQIFCNIVLIYYLLRTIFDIVCFTIEQDLNLILIVQNFCNNLLLLYIFFKTKIILNHLEENQYIQNRKFFSGEIKLVISIMTSQISCIVRLLFFIMNMLLCAFCFVSSYSINNQNYLETFIVYDFIIMQLYFQVGFIIPFIIKYNQYLKFKFDDPNFLNGQVININEFDQQQNNNDIANQPQQEEQQIMNNFQQQIEFQDQAVQVYQQQIEQEQVQLNIEQPQVIENNISTLIYQIQEEQLNDLEDCSICLETLHNKDKINVQLKCHISHIFHKLCILQWLENHRSCPICKCDL